MKPVGLFQFSCAVLVIASFAKAPQALAGEPDDFMARDHKEAPIANEIINRALNNKLHEVLNDYTPQGKACSRAQMTELMVDVFDRNFPDVYDLFASDEAINATAGANTAYDSPRGEFIRSHERMWVPSYRVKTISGEHLMGIDKIDHFFAHGYLHWIATNQPDSKDSKRRHINALKFSMEQENGPWGLKGSRVKSYADLAANDLGLEFWRSLFDGKEPIFVCTDGRYTMPKPFDLFKYLDASVDETINCSSFATKEIRDGVLAPPKKAGLTCPVSKTICRDLAKARPGQVGELTLHPLCRGKQDTQIEEPSNLGVIDVLNIGSGLMSGGTNLLSFWMKPRQPRAYVYSKPNNGTNLQMGGGMLEPIIQLGTPDRLVPMTERKSNVQKETAR